MITLNDLVTLVTELSTVTGKSHSIKTSRHGYHLVIDNTDVMPPDETLTAFYDSVEGYLLEQRAMQWEVDTSIYD